jgi:glycosyltransferase involved in cell wall biosynthesis
VRSFLDQQDFRAEVLVVENGSQDNTFAIASAFARNNAHFHVCHEEKNGKGLAVRRGMLEAKGKYRFMCDADLSMPIEDVSRFLPPSIPNPEIVIASREAPGAIRYNEPNYRHIGGRFINLVIRSFALPGLNDTQCGFKLFHAPIAEDIFQHQIMDGWSFDIEVLYIATLRGYQITELPIPWYYESESRINPVKDAIKMMRDVFIIRNNARLGYYARKT